MASEKIWAIKDGYLVNRDGSIYKLNWHNTGKMRKVKLWDNGIGYLRFNCNGKHVYVHRFVGECFIPNPNNLPEINHKDENKVNNCVNNLEWCDRKYNNNYGTRKKRLNKKHLKKVFQYTKNGKFVKEWTSAIEIKNVLGFNNQNISSCCLGKLKSAYNYIWSYEPLN